MTDEELHRIEAAAKAATPGPWKRLERWDGRVVVQSAGDGLTIGRFQILPDIEYVTALSPSVALALIAELRAAREVLGRVADDDCKHRNENGPERGDCMQIRDPLDGCTPCHARRALARAPGREGL